jgi:A/G-specific adenine glycosylase
MAAVPEPSPTDRDRESLLAWFAPRGRTYPWRRRRPDPYAVLVSEVMLQQTQARRVVPAYTSFLARFPTAEALAAVSRAEVVRAWGGLGYPTRAVRLHEAARTIVRDHGGRVPGGLQALRALPGVGPYTAAAVASIAFGEPVAAVDTNARRIAARYLHGAEPDELSPRALSDAAQGWVDVDRPGEWNQALMDLGREVCRPVPRCDACPLADGCRFRAAGRIGRIGRSSVRPQARFEGSRRQVRGRVVAVLREYEAATLTDLSARTGFPRGRVAEAVDGLIRDGVLERGGRGRVRLAES